MSLFQQSVLKKYLAGLDKAQLSAAWQLFQSHFHHPGIQQNIRAAKEEQYQEGFLRELFVQVLGYTLNPQPHYNLTTEYKNPKDSKKADGAILQQGAVRAVIELKGTDTTDLAKIESQAFGYLHNQKGCTYVITSNFEKLRFYIGDATDWQEFNLFTLTEEQFALLYLCLHKDHLLADTPLAIKQQSLAQEDAVTKKLYADYSQFKAALFEDMVARNPQYDRLELFRKTQKLLDRFLFILFAEDRLLLPPNFIIKIVEDWKQLQKLRIQQSLYDRFKLYFSDLLQGNPQEHIFAYNGGLFEPDAVLDGLQLNDTILMEGVLTLSRYDYNTEVDVNILGHIFEHSLNEIEELQASLQGAVLDRSKTKRKKDGVFYTPRYITKYMVENTIGTLCAQKKEALKITEEDYVPGKSKAAKKDLIQKLDAYRAWLLELTICDPACGSGAFLNVALEFLIAEHGLLDELSAKLLGHSLVYADITKDILEHNLYGVDINEEAVEIARLSLWLRTAQKGRKLSNLSHNIKCGNSLIDDAAVAGEKAFVWTKEFEQVFHKGGFDVVIGNPPYLRVQGLRSNFENESKFYENCFKSATGRFDIYVLFIEKSYTLINKSGLASFILPHKFIISDFGIGIRKFITEKKAIESIVSFGAEMVFADASTYTCIITISNKNEFLKFKDIKPTNLFNENTFKAISYSKLDENKWNLQSEEGKNLFEKLNKLPLKAKDIFDYISQGVVSVGDDIFLMKGTFSGDKFIGFSEKVNEYIEIEGSLMKPILKGEDVKKYSDLTVSYYVIYPHYENDGKTYPYEEADFKINFPAAYSYFLRFKEELVQKKIRYKTNPKYWYTLHRSREMSLFEQDKIITPEISLGTNMTLDYGKLYHNTKCYSLVKKKELNLDYKYLIAILNSNLLWYYLMSTGYVLRGGFFTFKTKYLESFPIPSVLINEQQPFIDKSSLMLQETEKLKQITKSFLKLLSSKFESLNISKNLSNWPSLSFHGFLKELEKQKIKLSLSEQSEWMPFFEAEKAKAEQVQHLIHQTDKEIDAMVYQLYGLTEEEIAIVENA